MKEKFTLEKWLQNKSLKVVDQQGREAPIKQWPLEDLLNPPTELYLIDEEEELDEFQKLYLKFLRKHVESSHRRAYKGYTKSEGYEMIKQEAKELLLAAIKIYNLVSPDEVVF